MHHPEPSNPLSADGLFGKEAMVLLKKLSALLSQPSGRNPAPKFADVSMLA
jgi:hypothetical protein